LKEEGKTPAPQAESEIDEDLRVPKETEHAIFDTFVARADRLVAESHRLANRITEANLTISLVGRKFLAYAGIAVVVGFFLTATYVSQCAVMGQPTSEAKATVCDALYPFQGHSASTTRDGGPEWWAPLPWAVAIAGATIWYRRAERFVLRAQRRLRQDTARSKEDQERKGYL
jgi:hypothetical protein